MGTVCQGGADKVRCVGGSRGQEFRWLVLVAFDKRRKEGMAESLGHGVGGANSKVAKHFLLRGPAEFRGSAALNCSLRTDDSDLSQGHR